jgi:hypothetical protein
VSTVYFRQRLKFAKTMRSFPPFHLTSPLSTQLFKVIRILCSEPCQSMRSCGYSPSSPRAKGTAYSRNIVSYPARLITSKHPHAKHFHVIPNAAWTPSLLYPDWRLIGVRNATKRKLISMRGGHIFKYWSLPALGLTFTPRSTKLAPSRDDLLISIFGRLRSALDTIANGQWSCDRSS